MPTTMDELANNLVSHVCAHCLEQLQEDQSIVSLPCHYLHTLHIYCLAELIMNDKLANPNNCPKCKGMIFRMEPVRKNEVDSEEL